MKEKETTRQYKRTMRATIGTGMSALAGGNGRRYYVLEHRDNSKYHKAGESQKIIIDQIELGCNPDCQVRFDQDTWGIVSRRHAAIEREGNRWKLIHLSHTNSTFVNGRKVETEWYLENGDEIQLAAGGPRLGFIAPEGKQGLVSSIRFTERLELFRKQALKPYKHAIAAMAVLFVIMSCAGGYKLYDLHERNQEQDKQMEIMSEENTRLHTEITEYAKKAKELENVIESLKGRIKKLERRPVPVPAPINSDSLSQYFKDIYFVGLRGVVISKDGETIAVIEPGDSIWGEKMKFLSGTGFILSDGTFVTARHVVEPWLFSADTINVNLNHLSVSGYSVVGHFFAVSSSRKPIEFTTQNFKINTSHDEISDVEITEDKAIKIRLVSSDYTDYATYPGAGSGSLQYDTQLSKNLKVGEKLRILGFPLGIGASSKAITPIHSTAEVAKDGLTEDGYILTTATGFEHGNSGGPVFVERDGKMVVVGIVSAGGGRSTGFVVPISAIKE